MKRFIVTEIAPVSAVWEYYVEADTKEEAINIAASGVVEPHEFRYEGAWNVDPETLSYDAEEV